jgi:hypothetical protein
MVHITKFTDDYIRVPMFRGLEEVVIFPGSENRKSIPNSTVWVFNKEGHSYKSEILHNDVGCGVAGFIISQVDVRGSADKIYDLLAGKNILGRGNHFVDVCGPFDYSVQGINEPPHNLLLIHCDGKTVDSAVPRSIEDALKVQLRAERFRLDLGERIISSIGAKGKLLGNWTHNSVEVGDSVIYRRGVIKVQSRKVHPFLRSVGRPIEFYSFDAVLPVYDSMPHGVGRKGPLGETKVSLQDAAAFRARVYVPAGIADTSLRSEHPDCYRTGSDVNRICKDILWLGKTDVLAYVGKV